MQTYKAPVRDMQFVLQEVLNVSDTFAEMPGFEEVNDELIDTILEEAGKLFEEVVFPTNVVGHEQGCRLEDGQVVAPDGFKEAYQAICEAGWLSLSSDVDYGGQGLPETLTFFIDEMFCSANMALSLYPGLTHGAYIALKSHASDEQKQTYLPKMVSGEWSGTMCLTEPQAGTDLGLVRTRAEPRGDASYAITGTKIFITAGEHDLTENIIHLVLARLPDAPKGVRGISLFIVPKFLVNEDGSLGERNGAVCQSIETKMGIKGVPACVMAFEDAVGFLVGEPHRGLSYMFKMMNHERLAVGLEGLGVAETAYQSAVAYARDRLQGRAPNGPQQPEQAADSIMVHPDVRRMLLTTRAYNESARALAGWVGMQIDLAESHPDAAVRERADRRVQLLTPVVKAYFTDLGTENSNQMLQVFGGAGYIADSGMEQLVRDARIAQIYEGTNGVQANDLVGRKLAMNGGEWMGEHIADMQAFIDANRDLAELGEFIAPFAAGVEKLQSVSQWLVEQSASNREHLGAASTDYLRLVGLVCSGFMWAQMAKVALERCEGDNSGFYQAKVHTARYFFRRLMPQAQALVDAIESGADVLMALEPEAF
jgi:alkylation response protein AidB-like acyl-CoA dehydrogenase